MKIDYKVPEPIIFAMVETWAKKHYAPIFKALSKDNPNKNYILIKIVEGRISKRSKYYKAYCGQDKKVQILNIPLLGKGINLIYETKFR